VGDVHDRLMLLGGGVVCETVDAIIDGTAEATPQEQMITEELRPAPKIFKETCRIEWGRSTKQVYDFVRGLSPYPAAWTTLVAPDGNEMVVKVYEASIVADGSSNLSCGAIKTDGKSYLYVGTADGMLSLRTLQLAGKKRMGVEDFLRGFRLAEGSKMV
jgi:methionyl-tRNA formyltransferase